MALRTFAASGCGGSRLIVTSRLQYIANCIRYGHTAGPQGKGNLKVWRHVALAEKIPSETPHFTVGLDCA